MDADTLYKKLANVENESELASYLECIRTSYNTEFKTYLKEIMDSKGIDRASLYRNARIERTYVYQLLDGKKTHPGKDKVIMLGLALRMSVNEIRYALELADTSSLNPRSVRDSILIYSIIRKNSIAATNALLEQFGEKPLE